MLQEAIVVEDPAMIWTDDTCDGDPSTSVVLADCGDKKIQVIKEVRALTNFGLRDAKDCVDGAPRIIAVEDGDIAAARLLEAGAEAYPLKQSHIETAIGLLERGAPTTGSAEEVSAVLTCIEGANLVNPKNHNSTEYWPSFTGVKNKLTVFQKDQTGDALQSFLNAITCNDAQKDEFLVRLRYLQFLVCTGVVSQCRRYGGGRYDLTLASPPLPAVRGMGILSRPNPEECENELRAIWAEMRTYVNELRAMRDTGQCAMTPLNPDYGNNDGRENPNTWVRDEYLAELEELISKGDELSCGAAMTAAVDKIVDSPEHDSWYDWQARHKNGYENSWALKDKMWSTRWPPDVERLVILQDDPDGPAQMEIHYDSSLSNPEKLIAELARKYPTLVFVESYAAKGLYEWGANVYIDGEICYSDGVNNDRVLSRLLTKVADLREAGESTECENRRIMERFEVLVNRSETDAKVVADVAVGL